MIGLTEPRAREIAEQAAKAVVAEYADESVRVIQERITKLDDRVIASLVREGRLEVFADRGFQRVPTRRHNRAPLYRIKTVIMICWRDC